METVADIFRYYCGDLNEFSIRNNFALLYLLLEEMFTNGFVTTTEKDNLRLLVSRPNLSEKVKQVVVNKSLVSDKLPKALESAVNWRSRGLKYSKNEIYLDIIEYFTAEIDSQTKSVISSTLLGSFTVKAYLSDMPEVFISIVNLNDLEDYSLHKCVQVRGFYQHNALRFIPPDSEFSVFKYRSLIEDGQVRSKIPVEVNATVSYHYEPSNGVSYGILRISVRRIFLPQKMESMKLQIKLQNSALSVDKLDTESPFSFNFHTKSIDCEVVSSMFLLKCRVNYKFEEGLRSEKLSCKLLFTEVGKCFSSLSIGKIMIYNCKYDTFKGVKKKVHSSINYRF